MTQLHPLPLSELPAFRNEPYLDFTKPENRQAMESALHAVRQRLGQEYPLLINGQRQTGQGMLLSHNPAHPSEVVGRHHKATPQQAAEAVQACHSYFPEWARTSADSRVQMLLRLADLLRQRKLELNAWLCLEAGKTWL